MMDGITIQYQNVKNKIFPIQEIQGAGAPQKILQNKNNCIEIMTGAVLPQNANVVIRYEDIKIENNHAHILIDEIKKNQNIHAQGTDRRKGEIIIPQGKKITAAEIGIAASVGKKIIKVIKNPTAAIFSTGDELVEINEIPQNFQIRKSNVYVLDAILKKENITSELIHINDNKKIIIKKITKALKEHDFLILSGGVSKGKYDFIPEVMEELGVRRLFHKVKQRPGKPFWLGKTKNNKIIFALPGNPVSTFMCAHKYILPWLKESLEQKEIQYPYAILKEDFYFDKDLQYFLQVKIEYDSSGKIWALPIQGKGSGDLANLTDADAFLELPREKNHFKKGEAFPFIKYKG